MCGCEGRVLGLDIGRKRVGVAVSDPLGMTAQPGPTLSYDSAEQLIDAIGGLIREWNVTEVVYGLPRGLKGQSGSTFGEVADLVASLRRNWPDVRWIAWDERFTTVEAERLLRAAPKKKRCEKGTRDRIAAQLILQGYLGGVRKRDGDEAR